MQLYALRVVQLNNALLRLAMISASSWKPDIVLVCADLRPRRRRLYCRPTSLWRLFVQSDIIVFHNTELRTREMPLEVP